MAAVHPPPDPDAPTAYRTLTLTNGGRVLSSAPLSARDDDEALSLAAAMARDVGVDLWDGLRFVAHFEPERVRATVGSTRVVAFASE
ncbi:hypothetical protein DHODJN_18755 [Methylorubrum extorquens]|jgi:hypothetical protein